jgi:hypothetical protein
MLAHERYRKNPTVQFSNDGVEEVARDPNSDRGRQKGRYLRRKSAQPKPDGDSFPEAKQRESSRIFAALRAKLLRLRNMAIAFSPRFTHRQH